MRRWLVVRLMYMGSRGREFQTMVQGRVSHCAFVYEAACCNLTRWYWVTSWTSTIKKKLIFKLFLMIFFLSDLSQLRHSAILFTYLGSSINSQGSMYHEINCRIRKASTAFKQLNKIWTSKKFTLKTKLRFYNSNVMSTLLYGCETWHLKLSQERKLDAFDMRCLWHEMPLTWDAFDMRCLWHEMPSEDPEHKVEWLHHQQGSQRAVKANSSIQ